MHREGLVAHWCASQWASQSVRKSICVLLLVHHQSSMDQTWETPYWSTLKVLCCAGVAISVYNYRRFFYSSATCVSDARPTGVAIRTDVPPDELDRRERIEPNYWTDCAGSVFDVRHGPAYATNGHKASSVDSMYDVFRLSVTNSAHKLPHIGRVAVLPPDADVLVLGLPPYIILHVMVPQYPPPGIFNRKRKDGISSHVTVYGRLSDSVRAMIREGRPPPAVSLFRRFVHPLTGAQLRKERLKLIAGVVNMQELGFDKITRAILRAYNYKPFLSRTASTFYATEERPPPARAVAANRRCMH